MRSWYLTVIGLGLVAALFAVCGEPPPTRRAAAVSVDAVLPGPCPCQEAEGRASTEGTTPSS